MGTGMGGNGNRNDRKNGNGNAVLEWERELLDGIGKGMWRRKSFPHTSSSDMRYSLLHFAWVEDHEKCIVVTRVCVSVCLSAATCLHYCTDPDVTWVSGRGCPLFVHYWADLQSVHRLHCCGNIMRTQNVSKYMLVLALCLGILS